MRVFHSVCGFLSEHLQEGCLTQRELLLLMLLLNLVILPDSFQPLALRDCKWCLSMRPDFRYLPGVPL